MNAPSHNRSKTPFRIVATIVVVLLGYYAVAVVPRARAYRRTLTTLHLETVQSVRLHVEDLLNGKTVSKQRVLSPEETATFLLLLSQARSHSPNHPSGGWTCFAEISTTTQIPVFNFSIHATRNDGVQVRLYSNGRDGWNYGTLRNDALKPFIEGVFRDDH